jgi:hypothetical protein
MKNKFTATIVLGAVGSLLAMALYFLLEYLFGKPLDPTQKSLIFGISILLGTPIISILMFKALSVIVKTLIQPRVEQEVKGRLESEIRKTLGEDFRKELESTTGIVKIFNNFRECEAEILGHVETSNTVRVFLQIGKTVLGGTTSFYDYLGRIIQPTGKVRILHASLESPYLSERIASERNSDYKEWKVDLDHATQKIENLVEKHEATLKSRQHKEGYVWRLFIFDEVAYVQPYLYSKNNSENAPVLKLSKLGTLGISFEKREENPSSLYKVFLNYFDFKWDECRPDSTSLSKFIPATDDTTVAVAAKYNQFYIFAIPSRYIKPENREIPFHGIGGKRKIDEDWIAAIERESKEEVGVAVTINSSARTRFHTTGAELQPISLDDSPRPYCVYKRTREADPNFAHPEVLWLIGYEGNLRIKSLDDLKPRAEVGALVCLTGDMLLRTLQEKVTYSDIVKADDGSRIILGIDVSLEMKSRAVPAGLAIIVAAEQRPKYLRGL